MLPAIAVGVAAGAFAGLFGVGGGPIIVPGLVMLAGMSQRLAHGTSLAAIVPIAAGGAAGYALEGSVHWTAGLLLAAGGAAGAVVGARMLERVREAPLRRGFGVFMIVSAGALLVHVPAADLVPSLVFWTAAALVAAGAAGGMLAGLLGVGGGIIVVPAMVLLLSVPDAVAKGTSLVVIIPTAIAGTVRNARSGNVDLRAGMAVGVAGIGASFAMSFVSVRLDPVVSSALFATLLVVLALQLLLKRA